ncbi:hypothetical protein FGF1_15730 [Flavobacteriaceae bacterium GF1]
MLNNFPHVIKLIKNPPEPEKKSHNWNAKFIYKRQQTFTNENKWFPTDSRFKGTLCLPCRVRDIR